jgi:hypothetical protein
MTNLTNKNGHPTSGTTTERTSSRYTWEPWETFYDTTLGQMMVYTGSAWVPTDGTYMPVATAAGAGSVIGNATAVGYGFTSLTGADNAVGVQLPTPVAGRVVVLKNLSTTAAVKVYPATGTQINALGNNAAQTLSANTACMYVAYNAAVVYTVPHAAS